MCPTDYYSSRDSLDTLLDKALTESVLPEVGAGLALAAPQSVLKLLKGTGKDYDVREERLETLAERLAADEDRPDCDIVVVTHPCCRVIPSMAEYGGPL